MAAPPSTASPASWNPAVPPPPVTGAAVGIGLYEGLGDGLASGVGLTVALGLAVGRTGKCGSLPGACELHLIRV